MTKIRNFFNALKDAITDILGLGLMGLSVYFFLWEKSIDLTTSLTLMAVGFILFWVPDSAILGFIKKWVGKKTGINENDNSNSDNGGNRG